MCIRPIRLCLYKCKLFAVNRAVELALDHLGSELWPNELDQVVGLGRDGTNPIRLPSSRKPVRGPAAATASRKR